MSSSVSTFHDPILHCALQTGVSDTSLRDTIDRRNDKQGPLPREGREPAVLLLEKTEE